MNAQVTAKTRWLTDVLTATGRRSAARLSRGLGDARRLRDLDEGAERRREHELAAGQLLLLLFHGDRLVEQVHVPSLQAQQLSHAQANETRNQHENAIALADAFGDPPDLIGGRDRTLGCALDAGSGNDAR